MKRLIFLLPIVFLFSCNSKKQADLIVHHAKIYTVDSAFTIVEAMAVKDGNIIATGKTEDILAAYESKEMIDGSGRTIYPGFIDAHAHFVGYGQGLFAVNLFDCKTSDEMFARVSKFADEHPSEPWIIGRGWDQNKFSGKKYPANDILNQLFPDRPVLLSRVDGHAALANNKALELAGIKPGQTLVGGEIQTNGGKLTGILIDNAVDLVQKLIPQPVKADYEKWLGAAQKNCFAAGLTTITDCGLKYNDVEMIDALQREGKLNMRLYVMLSDDTANYARYLSKGPYKTELLYVKGIKVYADGALGSRGACLLHPYHDQPEWNGFLLSSYAHFDSVAAMLSKTEFQMCTHAIGDSANHIVLQIYNKYLQPGNDKRWRIEHAQVVNAVDLPLFAKTAIIPSVQPTHATSDMYWAVERLGNERMPDAYAYKKLLQQNGWIPLGTDFPVEDISPLKTFLAAVYRRDAQQFPDGGFQIADALTKEEAIRGMTIWAAKADFLDKEIGSLEAGKKADFIILDQDLMSVPEAEVLNIKVMTTYMQGKKVFSR